MADYPGMVIELGSHTDCRGSDEYNLYLSDRRAKSSAAYIQRESITQRGYTVKVLVRPLLMYQVQTGVERYLRMSTNSTGGQNLLL